jgi:cobalamin-dependent methionine synthase I
MEKAIKKRCQLDFKRIAPKPKVPLGANAVSYSLEDVVPLIDWNPFFQTWE